MGDFPIQAIETHCLTSAAARTSDRARRAWSTKKWQEPGQTRQTAATRQDSALPPGSFCRPARLIDSPRQLNLLNYWCFILAARWHEA